MNERRIWIAVLALVAFISLTVIGISLAQEGKKIDGDVGWVTLDKKALTLVREGKHLMDVELGPEVVIKIMEEKKDEKQAGKKEGKKKAGKKDEGKEEAAKEVKEEKAEAKAGPVVTTICYTIRPGTVNDILSGWKAAVTYVEQGKKKIAKEIILTPVVFGGDDEE